MAVGAFVYEHFDEMSGVSSAGVTDILRELRKVIDKANKPEVLEVEDKPWRP